ncbi:MAG: homocysteine S-methyltransferase family protein [Victivallales bacterium]|nr:homocysteine S-methyltransferase family protein [Victivallales bacterium]
MNFLDELNNGKIFVFDGAMGTQLDSKGAGSEKNVNIKYPEKVKAVHEEYINSGSDIIITNTFINNRIYMESHKINFDVTQLNLKGVAIAKEAAADKNVLVAGDMGPTGQMIEPIGLYTKEQVTENYKEQAQLLEQGGVDFFIIETMMDLNESICALKACKAVSKLPVLASITFSNLVNGGMTMMGNSAEECAKKLTDNGADVLGSNCGDLDPFEMAELIKTYKKYSELPFLAQPNAGKPKLVNGKTVFNMPVEKYVDGIKKCLEAGAGLVGGCCGTSPEYIRAVSDLVK